jgi:hypothetical protein
MHVLYGFRWNIPNKKGTEMSFATRYGFAESKPLQLTTMDDNLRHSLWNELEDVLKHIENLPREYSSQESTFRVT